MTKALHLPSRPRHIRIWDEDWAFLEQHFGRTSARPIGATKAIRSIVHSFVERIKANAHAEQSAPAKAKPQAPAEVLAEATEFEGEEE